MTMQEELNEWAKNSQGLSRSRIGKRNKSSVLYAIAAIEYSG